MLMQARTSSGRHIGMAAVLAIGCAYTSAHVNVEPAKASRLRSDAQKFPSSSSLGTSVQRLRFYVEDDEGVESLLTRDTTELEHLIATLHSYRALESGWDGEGALAPSQKSLDAASDFACSLPPRVDTPEPLLHATGRAGLAWSRGDYYGEIEFLEDGALAYFFREGESKHKGFIKSEKSGVPKEIEVLLPVVES